MNICFESSDTHNEIAAFICKRNNDPNHFCHLCPQKMPEIQKNLGRIFSKENPSLLIFRDERNSIQAAFRLLVTPEDKYLELIWGFVQKPELYESLFDYLRTTYPGFHLDAVVTKANQTMYDAYRGQGMQYGDELILMTLEEYTPKPVENSIIRYSPEYEASFRAIHMDEGVYWTADRMLKALDRYDVFIAAENGEAVGYIEMTACDDENEPIQLFVKNECRGKGYGRALLQAAIAYNMPKKMILEVYANNTPALHLYRSLGFREKLREFTGSMTV